MIVTSMQLTLSSRRDIAVLQKESPALEGEEDVKRPVHLNVESPGTTRRLSGSPARLLSRDLVESHCPDALLVCAAAIAAFACFSPLSLAALRQEESSVFHTSAVAAVSTFSQASFAASATRL